MAKLKKYAVIYRSLEGINSAVVGLMSGATLFLIKDIIRLDISPNFLMVSLDIGIIILTFATLQFSKIPAPFIVLACLFFGWLI